MKTMIQKFLRLESASGLLLMGAAALALLLDNSPAAPLYDALLEVPMAVQVGALKIAKPLLLWINDGLMAVFFLLVGLEIKREVVKGELSRLSQATLPVLAAVGGMAAPALVFYLINQDVPENLRGWAIPAATDIAFALGVLTLVGPRVPLSVKVFLTALAIIDDLGAIVIIALFYTAKLSVESLALGALFALGLFVLNRRGVTRFTPYVLLGIGLWICVLKSGVHATLAGVVLAFAIPLRGGDPENPPLERMEHGLHPWVAYLVMPVFAFANAGLPLAGLSPGDLLEPLPLGIALGLVVGKQAGVFLMTWLGVATGLARRPAGATWLHLYGASLLAGVGFTMSLFIGTLAFASPAEMSAVRLGVLSGSLACGVLGYLVMRTTPAPRGS
ncbi:MAG: Na+/H+ antiporter NhaA [Thermoanaerobaculia bacterium]|nr:Na+/H+ antiporter NhaA [Thermoanaerobaculia bacterium]